MAVIHSVPSRPVIRRRSRTRTGPTSRRTPGRGSGVHRHPMVLSGLSPCPSSGVKSSRSNGFELNTMTTRKNAMIVSRTEAACGASRGNGARGQHGRGRVSGEDERPEEHRPCIPPHTAAALYQTGIARAALVATNENWNWSVTKAASGARRRGRAGRCRTPPDGGRQPRVAPPAADVPDHRAVEGQREPHPGATVPSA